jgi:hypothetical protein
MTQPAWPFVLPHGGSYTSGQVPSHTELNLLQEQSAAAADGRIWTDLAALKNSRLLTSGTLPATMGPNAVAHDPVSRRWFMFGATSGAAAWAWTMGSRIVGNGATGDLTDVVCAASSPAGVVLAGGANSGSTLKITETSNAGMNWTPRSIGSADSTIVRSLAYVQSLGLWLAAKSATGDAGIWSSSDRITWTKRSGLYGMFVVRESPTRILAVNQITTPGTQYVYSDDGITWTTQTFPVNLGTSAHRGCWSDHYGKFYVVAPADGVYSSSDGLTGSWTQISTQNDASVACLGRALLIGNGTTSVDGGATWIPVVDVPNATTTLEWHAAPGIGALGLRTSIPELYLSLLGGF